MNKGKMEKKTKLDVLVLDVLSLQEKKKPWHSKRNTLIFTNVWWSRKERHHFLSDPALQYKPERSYMTI